MVIYAIFWDIWLHGQGSLGLKADVLHASLWSGVGPKTVRQMPGMDSRRHCSVAQEASTWI
jgi:hypothetical protein